MVEACNQAGNHRITGTTHNIIPSRRDAGRCGIIYHTKPRVVLDVPTIPFPMAHVSWSRVMPG